MQNITATLADYIATAGARPLPDEVIAKTKHHILDTLAACVSGSQLAAGKRAIAYVGAPAGKPKQA